MKIRKEDEDDFGYLEEGRRYDTVLMVIRLVLLLAAVVVCIVIWKHSHNNSDTGQNADGQPVETLTETVQESTDPGNTDQQWENGNIQPSDDVQSGNGNIPSMDSAQSGNENIRPQDSEVQQVGDASPDQNANPGTDSLLTTDLTGNSTDTDIQTGADAQADTGSKTDSGEQTATDGSVVVNGDTVTTISGRTITFTPCDDTISPKMEVNLRGEPSTDQGNDTIHYRMMYGETAHRTGINEDAGWSRVEYNGEVLYVVTSYIYVVEDVQAQ